MDFSSLLQAYCEEQGLSLGKADKRGEYHLLLEQKTLISFCDEKKKGALLAYSPLFIVPVCMQEAVFRSLLKYNLFGEYSEGSIFSYNSTLQSALIYHLFFYEEMTPAVFAKDLPTTHPPLFRPAPWGGG